MAQKLFTPQEAAEIIKVEIRTVYNYIKAGQLVASRLGNRYRISEKNLEEFLEKRLPRMMVVF